jgi:feruloyl-CoA synthase
MSVISPPPPVEPVHLPVDLEHRADGAILVRPQNPLGRCWPTLIDALEHWAVAAPERTFIARRDSRGAWRHCSFAETLAEVRSLAASLVSRSLGPDRPLVILSGNSLEHQFLGLAAMYAGVPYVPVSPAYALQASDLTRLTYLFELLTPGLVAAFGPGSFGSALQLARGSGADTVADGAATDPATTAWDGFHAPTGRALEQVRARVAPDTIAKFLLTSGSTGHPKAVVTTHRMLCANQAMILEAMPFLADEPPVLVDWLPWNHTFGGSHNVGIALTNGGTLFIDDGKPTAAGIGETVRNLREIAPTVYFNVPRGFEMLIPHLDADAQLRAHFFSRLRAMFYAGAALSQSVWDGLDRIAMAATGHTLAMISGLGATETGPSVTFTTTAMSRAGAVGLPVAGNVVKLAPVEDKHELRVKGPNVTPGYWRQPELTAAAFDDEGYYRLGDAVRFIDAAAPDKGLQFDGRLTEDFKLASGTWVSVGPLRAALLNALPPWVQDVVIAGHDRDWPAALVFADAGRAPASPERSIEIARALQVFAAAHPQSSMKIRRAVVLDVPPSLAKGEITDKGSINQRAVLKERAAVVASLFAQRPETAIIVVAESGHG